ncbi:AMP-binding enzyme [Amycolatopsis sulphurea]|uniref:AMP-binding enzyme n=1 Tax=Amycolatopsis sulphurea TaxID=76022 RepID=A0A2A9G3C5_9PSEU|nr:condensation domain-containing protein [Amycolatopsis sulphurea]PFG57310.1 AMP-binding enzyme [Amycolatopsis sulphurea]
MPDDQQVVPTTEAQKGIWLAESVRRDDRSAYLWGEYTDIDGELDTAHLQAALRRACAETEAVNVSFFSTPAGELRQRFRRAEWVFPLVDLTGEPDPAAAAESRMRAALDRSLDLGSDRLLGGEILRLAARRHWLFLWTHHISLDGAGMTLLSRRIADVYNCLLTSTPIPANGWGGLRDLVDAEAEYRRSDAFERDAAAWRTRMDGRPGFLSLAPVPAAAAGHSARLTTMVPAEEFAALRAAAEATGHRWSRTVAAATAVCLQTLTGSRDVVLSLPVTARCTELSRSVPSMSANVLPLRIEIPRSATIAGLTSTVADRIAAVQRHQRYRGERLRRELGYPEDGRKFFGPVLNIQRFSYGLRFGPGTATVHNVAAPPSEDLSIVAYDRGDGGLRLDFDGNPANHDTALLAQVRDRFVHVLRQFTESPPDALVARLPVATPRQRETVATFGTGAPTRDGPDTAIGLFSEHVRRTPETFAVSSAQTGERLTYRELDARAGRLAARLGAHGAVTGTTVGLLLERSVDLVVAVLATVKTGAAYVPLHREDSPDRLAAVARDADFGLLVTDAATGSDAFAATFRDRGGTTVDLGRPEETAAPAAVTARPDQLACVMFTSGSTGEPKGAAITHGNLASLAKDRWWTEGATARVLLHSPHAFDALTSNSGCRCSPGAKSSSLRRGGRTRPCSNGRSPTTASPACG